MFQLLLSASIQEYGLLLFVHYRYRNLVFCFLSSICNRCLTGGMINTSYLQFFFFVVNFALIFDNFALTFFFAKEQLIVSHIPNRTDQGTCFIARCWWFTQTLISTEINKVAKMKGDTIRFLRNDFRQKYLVCILASQNCAEFNQIERLSQFVSNYKLIKKQ